MVALFALRSRTWPLPLESMILRRSSRPDPGLVFGSALALALPLGADLSAFAQSPPSQIPSGAAQAPAMQVPWSAAPAPDADALKQHDQDLDAARSTADSAAANLEAAKAAAV